jgi:hypothetical protein
MLATGTTKIKKTEIGMNEANRKTAMVCREWQLCGARPTVRFWPNTGQPEFQ